MKTSELAYKAAEYMAEHGHCKHAIQNKQGNVCWLGALEKVEGLAAWHVLEDIAQAAGLASTESAVNWNNAPETTGEDVILALKKAGAKLEAEGR